MLSLSLESRGWFVAGVSGVIFINRLMDLTETN